MTETVVQVDTLDQWKALLDVWFEHGYKWYSGDKDYREEIYWEGSRQLGFNVHGWHEISYWSLNDYTGDNLIEYSDFMAQQEKSMAKETYYVTKAQLDLIDDLKESDFPVYKFYGHNKYKPLAVANNLSSKEEKMLLRYLGGDTSIEFKVKEQLYLLKRTTFRLGPIYFNKMGNEEENDYCFEKRNAFTAPLEEIKKWKTPAWSVEEVN